MTRTVLAAAAALAAIAAGVTILAGASWTELGHGLYAVCGAAILLPLIPRRRWARALAQTPAPGQGWAGAGHTPPRPDVDTVPWSRARAPHRPGWTPNRLPLRPVHVSDDTTGFVHYPTSPHRPGRVTH